MEANTNSELLSTLRQFRISGEYCDLFFSISNRDFDLHAAVMAFRMNDYIKAHYHTGRKLNGEGHTADRRIIISNFPGGSDCFEQVLKFCYDDATFSINIDNVLLLHNAAEYFGMVNKGNLSERVHSFLDEEVIGESVVNIEKAKELYRIAVAQEKEYDLPNTISQRCLAKIATFVRESSNSLIDDFLGLLDLPDVAYLLQEAKNQEIPIPDISSFVAKVFIRVHDQSFRIEKPPIDSKKRKPLSLHEIGDKEKTLQQIWNEFEPDIHLIHENEAVVLASLDEHFLRILSPNTSTVQILDKYLRPQQTNNFKEISIERAIDFANLCVHKAESEGTELEKQVSQNNQCSPIQTYQVIIKMLVQKLQVANTYLPPSCSCYWVQGAGSLSVNGKYLHDGEFMGQPKYSKINPDGSVCTLFRHTYQYGKMTETNYFISELDKTEPGTIADFDFYRKEVKGEEVDSQNSGMREIVPSTGWIQENGNYPSPTVCCATYL